ncbi:MAG: putative hydrolase [Gemmatimonadetes bacterium]|nr:putative hydrolase [Gemmatimonadota bacterium]
MIALLPGGLELAYDDAGAGVPLLMIHGWPHDRTLWAGQMSGLSTATRCIAPDLRGFGGSTVSGPYTIDQYADDLAAFLDALGIERAAVCGLSMGGYIALALLRRHRTRVRALILADTRATADTAEVRENRGRLIALIEEHGVEALAARQLRPTLGRSTFEHNPQLVESVRRMMAAAPAEGAIGGLRAMAARSDSSAMLSAIDVPTLVVGGAEDSFTPPEELQALAAAIPRSRFELLERCGHVCPIERPAAFNHVVSEFLGALLYH